MYANIFFLTTRLTHQTELSPLKIVPCPTTNLGQGSLVVPRHAVTVGLCFERPCDACHWHQQRCQSIDQPVALEGLSKALFLNLCWQAMTWWRWARWIDCVLSLLSLSRSHSHFPRPLSSSPSSPCPITLFPSISSPPSSSPTSFSTHRLDVSSTRCQIISQQTLRCVTEDWSCISLDDTSSASPPLSLQTTSNIAGPFWSLKRLVLGEEPVLKQKQTKCFICHVCQWAICAA